VAPQIAEAVFSPSPQKKDDDGDLGGFAKRVAEEIGAGTVSGVPVFRDLASAMANGRDYTFTPIEQVGQSLVTSAEDAGRMAQGEPTSKRALQNAAQAAGYTFGIPTAQPAATMKFLWDVMDGDADPQGMKDWWSGVMTGRLR
jgi:hypothetical protein